MPFSFKLSRNPLTNPTLAFPSSSILGLKLSFSAYPGFYYSIQPFFLMLLRKVLSWLEENVSLNFQSMSRREYFMCLEWPKNMGSLHYDKRYLLAIQRHYVLTMLWHLPEQEENCFAELLLPFDLEPCYWDRWNVALINPGHLLFACPCHQRSYVLVIAGTGVCTYTCPMELRPWSTTLKDTLEIMVLHYKASWYSFVCNWSETTFPTKHL